MDLLALLFDTYQLIAAGIDAFDYPEALIPSLIIVVSTIFLMPIYLTDMDVSRKKKKLKIKISKSDLTDVLPVNDQ